MKELPELLHEHVYIPIDSWQDQGAQGDQALITARPLIPSYLFG
jgi:hypothetical protein